MNVLFILSDQHARDFCGCYGGRARTPHIDALASRGTRFTSAYACSPLCAPGRASLFAGRHVHELGVWDNTTGLRGDHTNWPAYLSASSVAVTLIGRLDFHRSTSLGKSNVKLPSFRDSADVVALYRERETVERRAFYYEYFDLQPRAVENGREVLDETTRDDQQITNSAIEWLRHDRPKDRRPWVLYVGYSNPHPKWHPNAELFDHYLKNALPLSPKHLQPFEDLHPADQRNSVTTCAYRNVGPADIQRMHAAYAAVAEEFDREVGKLTRAIENEGLLDETMIIYCVDHGESARAHGNLAKSSMYEESIGVPLVIAGPNIQIGRVEHTPVSHLDVFPTIAQALGVSGTSPFRGQALQPMLGGADSAGFGRSSVFAEYHANHAPNAIYMLRQGPWKYVEHLGGEAPSLFNLDDDPDEMNDLAAGDVRASAAARVQRERMRASLLEVCDIEAVDARAKEDQRRLRQSMEAQGTLAEQIYLRGYERRTDRLVPWDWQAFEELYHPR